MLFLENKSARLRDIVEVSNDPMVNFHDLGSRLHLLMEVSNDSSVNFRDLGWEIVRRIGTLCRMERHSPQVPSFDHQPSEG